MKNFHRDQNVNGNPYVWRYINHEGNSRFVPCDKYGWVDAKKYQPDFDVESGCSVKVIVSVARDGIEIPREPDFYISDHGRGEFWARNSDVVGWHPVILAMGMVA